MTEQDWWKVATIAIGLVIAWLLNDMRVVLWKIHHLVAFDFKKRWPEYFDK